MAKVVGLSQEDRDLIQHNYENLLQNIYNGIDGIVDTIYTHKLIDPQTKANILSKNDNFQKARAVLDTLPTRGPRALEIFLIALEKVSPATAKDIEHQRRKSRTGTTPTSPTPTQTDQGSFRQPRTETSGSEKRLVNPDTGGEVIDLFDAPDASPFRRSVGLSQQFLYDMNKKPHGYAIIINNRDFEDMPKRNGTDKDAKDMETQLVNLGYRVAVGNNLSAAKMRDVLQRWAAKDHTEYDSFICVILTHGEKDYVYGTDDRVKLEDLISLFRGDRCLSLVGKPKLFFVQACRGTKFDEAIDSPDGAYDPDSLYNDEFDAATRQTLPSETDFLIAYSVVPGYYSWRNSSNGSWFIQAVVDVFKRYSDKMDVLGMLTLVNNQVANIESSTNDPRFNQKKQTPSCVNMLRKFLYFSESAVKNHGLF